MIPRTQICYGTTISAILNGNDTNFPKHKKILNNIRKKCAGFEKLYNAHIKTVLHLIEKKTRCKKWKYPFIPIFIVSVEPKFNHNWKAISDPLILKFIPNPERMFKIMIHELVHNNAFKGSYNEQKTCEVDRWVYEEIRKADKNIKLDAKQQDVLGDAESAAREKLYKILNTK